MLVNIVGAPCAGKSTLACSIFSKLKSNHHDAEYVAEYAKQLVWQGDFDLLNNQHYVASRQYKMIKSIINKVDYLICDSPLFISLFYNEYNENNTSNVQKTKDMILDKMSEFEDSIYIFIKRNKQNSYHINGRVHDEEQSIEIEDLIEKMLVDNNIKYFEMTTGDDIEEAYNYIIKDDMETHIVVKLWTWFATIFLLIRYFLNHHR